MQKITPFLWFDDNAEEAVAFYRTLFKDSCVDSVMPGSGGKAMGLSFTLEGQSFMALNGGPVYQLTPAFSMYVNCETQEEVDRYWSALGEGGKEQRCGWLVDRFGLSWQIIPKSLSAMLQDSDCVRAARVMQAMMTMGRIDIAALQAAFDGA
ncbi:VOC family protein [Variovorax sp. OV329]|uniref:VOC family protein n=1 Tax=Variovorax sp. OV329 TaxID=1882825 RepID=UPI0008EF45F0|nr:VOC family protein [Variovorax sp. OV329]SFM02707.1 Glyoxalase superfamily enzyme, possibly 3-demethylubiquinone-9 3-methyltransferase [Variovorax sp. OV329]